ncbi:DNA primase catalytic subunit PriS [Methanothermobacter thermautotrophicus]|uniref:DNA primase small subunit PriS n=1 Tax=Methanothermobacter thermautotrophicus TaxID=145262 RepID=A0A842YPC6_METTF|nr:DNA primase catalytic subunit PriS [Methanothermobacter thermautotrophicus]MBE2900817.1 DNA primase catalytic subunit PriS [Methanothermobacter thermautotrophicus]
MMVLFEPATPLERKRYYREEWNVRELPAFIADNIHLREFGFDHNGRGPSDRYRVFRDERSLSRFMRARFPFAAYSSVAFYREPGRRKGWQGSELIFDVDAKDLPVRSCECDGVCPTCLDEARELVLMMVDTLRGDLGLGDIHVIYSGRGYHVRVLDPDVMELGSEVRAEILRYTAGAREPRRKFTDGVLSYEMEHFSIPLGYHRVFTERARHVLLHMRGDEEMEDVTARTVKDAVKNRDLILEDRWGDFKAMIGPRVYPRLVKGISKINMRMLDAKVTIDLKRILRLPTSLHSKVSMICMEVKNPETFDPLKIAVPRFVDERE